MIWYFPLAAITLLLGATLLRGWTVKRRSGTSAWAFASATGKQRVAGLAFAASFVPLGFAAVEVMQRREAGGGPLWLGSALAVLGTGSAIIAQIQLGNAWRVGVKEGDAPIFVNTGFYRYSRNPIFMGMFVMAAGIALASGRWWPWAGLGLLMLSVAVQVGIEERHLGSAFGDDYARFRTKVPRWIGLPR